MTWTASKIFRQYVGDCLKNNLSTAGGDITADTVKAALYDNDITPDQDTATPQYNVGQWVITGNEVSDTNWAAGGVALASKTVNVGTAGVVFFDAADTAGAGNVTLANVYGCLVYDDTLTATGGNTLADMGLCYNYFGGSQSVTAGTFTVVWSANGIFRFTLT